MNMYFKPVLELYKGINYLSLNKLELIAFGYMQALEDYGIWKDGEQKIGCMEYSVPEMKAEIMSEVVNYGKTE